ncbi:MAG: DUF3800 domain-containing protein [Cytophagales bacterium]|nr:DUF3800 domain-containing protein [Cytophagales bacterium]
MKYYLFIDESGDHGLTHVNPDFPVFLLCGVLMSEQAYEQLKGGFNHIKKQFWNNKTAIFHSRDIRKCEKEFVVLFDSALKRSFYEQLNLCIAKSDYSVINAAIRKDQFIKKYGRLSNDVYEISLSFIIERSIFCLDSLSRDDIKLEVLIEKRGKKEDRQLAEHFQKLLARGTGYVDAIQLKNYGMAISFKSKRENINGLQLADLIAYPVARFVLDPNRANPAYDLIQPKIYRRGGKLYGLKIFP